MKQSIGQLYSKELFCMMIIILLHGDAGEACRCQ